MRYFRIFLLAMLVILVALSVPFSLLAQEDMEDVETAHKEAILRIIEEAFNQGDLSVIDELFASDYVNHLPGNNIDNREDFKAFISAFRTAMPDYEASVDHFVAEGDWIAFFFSSGGTFENEMPGFPGLPPTGERVDLIVNVILRFNEDGQIIEEWDVGDNLPFLTQMGVLPPMEAGADE